MHLQLESEGLEELRKCKADPVYFYKKYFNPSDFRSEHDLRMQFDVIFNNQPMRTIALVGDDWGEAHDVRPLETFDHPADGRTISSTALHVISLPPTFEGIIKPCEREGYVIIRGMVPYNAYSQMHYALSEFMFPEHLIKKEE